jgi:fructoselysine-6-P-deglycase FrlB-like protein
MIPADTHGATGTFQMLSYELSNMDEVERRKIRSRELVQARIAMLEGVLARANEEPAQLPTPMLARARGSWVVTGVGASSGPAKALASTLRGELSLASEYLPLSAFLGDEGRAARGDVLVVFSQRLSPNALLPLARAQSFGERWAVTTLDPERDAGAARLVGHGVRVLLHPPDDERDLFLRLLGPAAATVTALRWVAELARALGLREPDFARKLGGVPAAVRAAVERAGDAAARVRPALQGRLAFVAAGRALSLASALPLKWIEGVGGLEPPLWDVLGFVHGPLQAMFEEPVALVALETPGQRDLFDRLARVIVPGRHTLVRLEATLPPPLCVLEHDAMVSRLVLAALEASPRDLLEWPGKGADAPLYELAPRPSGARS